MTADAVTALLARRVGWGHAATVDELLDPDGHGIAPSPDPWDGVDLTPVRPGPNASEAEKQQARRTTATQAKTAINAWLDHLATTTRPLEDWMVWFWHGHFVSGLDKVKSPLLMVQQLRTFRSLAFAPFADLVRAVTVDPAMLLYLDGSSSTGSRPNENYGRELLELFTLGIGHYGEDDVKAGARALTGWFIDRRSGGSRFAPRSHDDTPQRYLGVDGVHDVDSVVAAIVEHPACAPFVAGKLARAVLGPVDDGFVTELAATFAASGLDTRVLVKTVLDAATDHVQPTTVAPVPWLVAAQRVTAGTVKPAARLAALRAAGQVPMMPPNVAGWPSGAAWFNSSTMAARYQLAIALATSAPHDNAAFVAASSFDLDALAAALLRPDGFGAATRAALEKVRGAPREVLALALAAPESAVV